MCSIKYNFAPQSAWVTRLKPITIQVSSLQHLHQTNKKYCLTILNNFGEYSPFVELANLFAFRVCDTKN